MERWIESMSMGIASRWHAKMAFMMGMYWCARSVEGEAVRRKMRDWSLFLSSAEVAVARGLVDGSEEAMPVRDSE